MTTLALAQTEQPLPVSTALTPSALIAQAIAGNASIETLERLMAMQERWQANQARAAFNAAIAEAKGEIGPIFKRQTATGGARFQFESLDDIERAIGPVLSRHGLSYRFRTESNPSGLTVFCVVSHVDGHREENSLYAAFDNGPGRTAIQAIGSTQTYLQRYSLKAALGLSATKDDDGASSENTDRETEWLEGLRECDSLQALQAYWKGIWPEIKVTPSQVQGRMIAAKDAAKKRLLQAGGQ